MLKKYQLNYWGKLYFYIRYSLYILLIPFECKKGRFSLILAEVIWAIGAILGKNINIPQKFIASHYVTKYGSFTIQPYIMNVVIAAATSERLDMELFLTLIKKELDRNKKLLVLDIGACFGTYTVAVGNAFKNNKNIDIYAFEPDIPGSSWYPFAKLKKNIADNAIRNAELYHVGLGSKDADKSDKSAFATKRLDSLITKDILDKYDCIFIKMDIEGQEMEALKGARYLINNSSKIILLVEDFINSDFFNLLEKDFVFYKKLTPYNSFWIKK